MWKMRNSRSCNFFGWGVTITLILNCTTLKLKYVHRRKPRLRRTGVKLLIIPGKWKYITIFYTWVRASWIEFNNCFPTRRDLFSLLHFCRQLYMFRMLTPIIKSWYSCNYSFWYWLTGSTTIRFRCWVGTDIS